MGPKVASVHKNTELPKSILLAENSPQHWPKLKYIMKIKTIVFNLPLHLSTHTPPEKAACV